MSTLGLSIDNNQVSSAPPAVAGAGTPPGSELAALLICDTPFHRNMRAEPVVESAWAEDLMRLAEAAGCLRVAAPEIAWDGDLYSSRPHLTAFPAAGPVSFVSLPVLGPLVQWRLPKMRATLRKAIGEADVVLTSQLAQPYLAYAQGHEMAVRASKYTIFVGETRAHGTNGQNGAAEQRDRRRLSRLRDIERTVAACARTADVVFWNPPVAFDRYRPVVTHLERVRKALDEIAVTPEARSAALMGRLRMAPAIRHVVAAVLALLAGRGSLGGLP